LRWPLLTWLRLPNRCPPRPEPITVAVANARLVLAQAAAAGRAVPPGISQPILDARAALAAGPLPAATEQAFYAASTELARMTTDISKRLRPKREYPFEDAIEDAELLLKHAAETGVTVPPGVADRILEARTALKAGTLEDPIRSAFYTQYAELSKLFGTVTAETIRHCSSRRTKRRLRRDQRWAACLTILVALVSVINFVADSNLKKVEADIITANDLAAKLRVGLSAGANPMQDLSVLATDPCGKVTSAEGSQARTLADVSELQDFAATIREVQSRSIKLNGMVKWITLTAYEECNAFAVTCAADWKDPAKKQQIDTESKKLQINAAIVNYPAEVLCRISTYQEVRSFATNVADNYSSIVGAVTSYALPILYALLGAYAFRLRQFAETILKRTYHPSFSDSARMITAVIAGAICGLFNPAQGLSLSPLSVAFLVGYGVELFFRLLDTMINSFSVAGQAAK
jgi:hypothetical protein